MSRDTTLRTLARQAESGDVEAQARQLAERVRVGTLTRERLELAAYCGNAPARLTGIPRQAKAPPRNPEDGCEACSDLGASIVGARDGLPVTVPCPCTDPLNFPLSEWVSGLRRWGRDVLIRASLTSAYSALFAEQRRNKGIMLNGHRLLNACRAWLDDPCERLVMDWHEEWADSPIGWAPMAPLLPYSPPESFAEMRHRWIEPAICASRVAGESVVREDMQAALVSWALAAMPGSAV